jgi:hypothetical protein
MGGEATGEEGVRAPVVVLVARHRAAAVAGGLLR